MILFRCKQKISPSIMEDIRKRQTLQLFMLSRGVSDRHAKRTRHRQRGNDGQRHHLAGEKEPNETFNCLWNCDCWRNMMMIMMMMTIVTPTMVMIMMMVMMITIRPLLTLKPNFIEYPAIHTNYS